MSQSLAPTAPDERFFHDDLTRLDVGALQLERDLLRHKVMLTEPTVRWYWWYLERLKRIEAELEPRHAR